MVVKYFTIYNFKLAMTSGGDLMKQRKLKAEKILVSAVEGFVSANVNSACFWISHQPKLPNGCAKLKNK